MNKKMKAIQKAMQDKFAQARKAQADILLFGHTHRAYCQQEEDGLWVLNPGSSRKSYGTIQLEGSQCLCTLTRLI